MAHYNLYGENGGMKFDDLIKYGNLIQSLGLKIPFIDVIGVNHFYDFMAMNSLTEKSFDSEIKINSISFPDDLASALSTITEKYSPQFKSALDIIPLAVRSSSLYEKGGSGIFSTVFVTPNIIKAKETSWYLKKAVMEVYKSEFSKAAKTYRDKYQAKMGMAVMIQPVVGCSFENEYCPIASGTAYTDYYGQKYIRLVAGLGTKAVEQGQPNIIFTTNPANQSLSIERLIKKDFQEIDAIGLSFSGHNSLANYNLPAELTTKLNLDLLNKLWDALDELKKYGEFYLEWAIDDKDVYILQICEFEQQKTNPIQINTNGKKVLLKTSDIVNYGIKTSRLLFNTGICGWTRDNLDYLEDINRANKDYVLIVPQYGFTGHPMLSVRQISYEHFSNAAVIIESQFSTSNEDEFYRLFAGLPNINHTTFGNGGTHFQQICDREDILFLGGEVNFDLFNGIKPVKKFGRSIYAYEMPMEVINSETQGVVLVSGSFVEPEYRMDEIENFCDILYEIIDEGDGDGNELFIKILDMLIPIWAKQNIIGFNPYKINFKESETDNKTASEYINKVLQTGKNYSTFNDSRLPGYLKKLLKKL